MTQPYNRLLRVYGSGIDAGKHGAMNPARMVDAPNRRQAALVSWLFRGEARVSAVKGQAVS
jgi:hypothetical protein